MPSFYRSISKNESNVTNKYFSKTMQVNYDSPERYLFEFFKHPGYLKFRREYYKYAKEVRANNKSPKPVKIGNFTKPKTIFLELEGTLLLLSKERIKCLPVVSWLMRKNFPEF